MGFTGTGDDSLKLLGQTDSTTKKENKFSFNSFVRQSQPELEEFVTERHKLSSIGSLKVVENAMAQYKNKL